MANPHKFYLVHMHDKTGYRATWDPGRTLKIGQIVKLDSFGVLTIFSSLQKEGIPVEIDIDTTTTDMDYTSHDEVSIEFKLSGSAPAAGSVLSNAEAGVSIDFKSSKGIVFQTVGNKTHQLTNVGEIERTILEKYNQGNWNKDWLIITQLVESATGTVIISNSSNGKLELKAKADVGTENLSLTNANLGLSVAREQGSTLKYITQDGLTPLYRLMGVRHPFLGSPYLGDRSLDEQPAEDRLTVQEFDPQELD